MGDVRKHKFRCIVCGIEGWGQRNQKLCSTECNNKYTGKKSFYPFLSTGTVGAIQEYRVSVELLMKGYEVFRSVSPNCSCDLLARKNGKVYDVEVKTGYQNTFGGFTKPPPAKLRANYLALALPDRIEYFIKTGNKLVKYTEI